MENTLGILMLDTKFPRIVGDIGNEQSFSFPIIKKTIYGADPKSVVIDGNESLLKPFIEGAIELEKQGVKAITTSCGFLAMFQKELSNAVKIPVFASALLLANTISAMLPEEKIVGIMTANSETLSEKHFRGVSIENVPKVVYGMEGTGFSSVFVGNSDTLDKELAEKEMVKVAKKMVEENPNVGAILFECTNMPPYTKAVEEGTGLKVYHILSLAEGIMR